MVRLIAVLLGLLVWSCGRTVVAEDKRPLVDDVRRVLSEEPVSQWDDEGEEQRAKRLDEIASAIVHASQGSRRRAAALLALGHHESNWARYVGDGCQDVPDGAPDCDRGKARSYWQVHRSVCPRAWGDDSLDAYARCADRVFWRAVRRCRERSRHGEIAGGFSGYTGASCNWGLAAKRAKTYRLRLAKLSR